jgi:hypothetical protein
MTLVDQLAIVEDRVNLKAETALQSSKQAMKIQ